MTNDYRLLHQCASDHQAESQQFPLGHTIGLTPELREIGRFVNLALDRELLFAHEMSGVIERFRDYPEFFVTVNQLLSKSDAGWPAQDLTGLGKVILDAEDVSNAVKYLLRSSQIEDARLFNCVWTVLAENMITDIPLAHSQPEDYVDRVLRVVAAWDSFGLAEDDFKAELIAESEVIIAHSSEPEHDLVLIHNSDRDLPNGLTAQSLRKYYASEHRYICHLDYFHSEGNESEDYCPSLSRDELALSARLTRLKSYPALNNQARLVRGMVNLPEVILSIILDLYDSCSAGDVGSLQFTHLVDAIVDCQQQPRELGEALHALKKLHGQDFTLAAGMMYELIAERPDGMREVTDHLERGDLAAVSQLLYHRRLQRDQAQFDEQSLEEVRRKFETRSSPDAEIPNSAVLDRAFRLYQQVSDREDQHRNYSLPDLIQQAETLKASGALQHEGEQARVEFFALTREIFKREFGVRLNNVQMIALLIMTDPEMRAGHRGLYAQFDTGEGKSLIATLFASYQAFRGRSIYMATSNEYLAGRDALGFRSFYEILGISSDSYVHTSGAERLAPPTVLYSTNANMIFGYLSSKLKGREFFAGQAFDVALIDEADNICLDLFSESCRIAPQGPRRYSEAVLRDMLAYVDNDESAAKRIREKLPEAIADFVIKHPALGEEHPVILGLYLQSAVNSADHVQDEDYVVKDGKIVIVDKDNTGRLKPGFQWSHGLHEFVTLRQGLALQPHLRTAAEMRHPTLLCMFKELYCITGTLGDRVDRNQLRDIYDLVGFDVPRYRELNRVDSGRTLVRTEEEYLDILSEQAKASNPCLMLAESIRVSKLLYERIITKGETAQLLNGDINLDANAMEQSEHHLIGNAGRMGEITVATNLATRGADIILDNEARQPEVGGLETIVGYEAHNKRVEMQARGRSGRQGDPGRSDVIVCAEHSYFKSLPQAVQDALLEIADYFGNSSKQLNQAMDFVRHCNNIHSAVIVRSQLEKGDMIQQALERYWASVSETAATLRKRSPGLQQMKSGAEGYVVSLFLQDRWANGFEDLSAIIHNYGIDQPDGESDVSVWRQSSKSYAELEHAFEVSFGAPYVPDWPRGTDSFSDAMLAMFEAYERTIISTEYKLSRLDTNAVGALLSELDETVSNLTGACVRLLKDASRSDIFKFIEQERLMRNLLDRGNNQTD